MAAVLSCGAASALGQSIYVGPGYTTAGGGIKAQGGAPSGSPLPNTTYTLANSLTPNAPSAIGLGSYYTSGSPTTNSVSVAYYWDSTNSPTTNASAAPDPLLSGYVQPSGLVGKTQALAINNSAAVGGVAYNYSSTGGYSATQAAIWTNPSGAPSTPLLFGTIATTPDYAGTGNFTGYAASTSGGLPTTEILGLNNNGLAVGFATEYDQGTSSTANVGSQPVYWAASSTSGATAQQLTCLGYSNTTGYSSGQANAVNGSGTIVGQSAAYSGNSTLGSRPVSWAYNASSSSYNAPAPLGALTAFTSSSGTIGGNALLISSSGVSAGEEQYYPSANTQEGVRPMRWQSNGVADQLQMPSIYMSAVGSLGNSANNSIVGLNDTGDAVGNVNDNLHSTGYHPFLWLEGSTNYIMLQQASFNGTYATKAGSVYSINTSDDSVGYDTNSAGAAFAAIWNAAGTEYNLYSLFLSLDGGNTDGFTSFNYAESITAAGWISGEGTTSAGFQQAFLVQIPASVVAVPEPASLSIFALSAAGLLRRRRKSI